MKKKLPELCKIQYGYAFDSAKYTDDMSYPPLVRIRDIKRGFSETFYCGEYSNEYVLHSGDLLIGMDGEFNIARWRDRDALLNQRVCKIVAKDGICEEYLRFALIKTLKAIEDRTSFVTVKHLSAKELNNIELDIPLLEEQNRIASCLSKTEKIIELRNQQLEKLDLLVKSRFIEMFGDPVENERNWKTNSLDRICNTIVDCPHSTPHYTNEDTGFMCVRTSIVKKNQILWDQIEYISEEEFKQRVSRKKPEKGDIIYTREGAILGIAAVIDRDCNISLGQRSMLLSPNKSLCLPTFLSFSMNFDTFYNKVTSGISGSASPHINVADVKAFELILPPIELQTQFATFVQQVDKSKFVIKQSIEKLELLKNKLMQDYFG